MKEKIKICELFGPTVEGEGSFIGVPFIVVRLSGCNLKCSFCDTRFSSHFTNDEEQVSIEYVFDYIEKNKCKNVSITGGEPFFRSKEELDNLFKLCEMIKTKIPDSLIKIETNATLLDDRFFKYIDFWSMSPKLLGMGEDLWFSKEVINRVLELSKGKCQLKFVVGSRDEKSTLEEDLETIKSLINDLKRIKEEKIKIILQPEGLTEDLFDYINRGVNLVERVINNNNVDWDFWKEINLLILPQWHRILWNNARRK